MVYIYTTAGDMRFKTQINVGSKRVFKIMGDDYVTLKFSVKKPVYFKLGDYCDIDGFGRFELVKPYQPAYNKRAGGYDYELKLEAQHMKWRNKIMRYLPNFGGHECSWTLTATAAVHLEQVLLNIEALSTETRTNGDKVLNVGYKYNGVADWGVEIHSTVDVSAKTLSYDKTNIIDALTAIAEAYECEWWVDGNIIHLGKCELTNEYIDLELNRNVAEMSRSDSAETFATRIIVFGSERNISPRYRKDLIFDVKAVENGGNRISDTARPLTTDCFPASLVSGAADNPTSRIVGLRVEQIDAQGNVVNAFEGCSYNPDGKELTSERNWLQLPAGYSMQTGSRYRIVGLLLHKVKSSYFSDRYSAYQGVEGITKSGIVTRRLMLPESHGTPYIDVEPDMPMEQGVEDVVVFDNVYPRAECVVTSVETIDRKETVDNDDGTSTETTFKAYVIKDDFFTSDRPFQYDYIIPNKTLKITFGDGKRYKEDDNIPAWNLNPDGTAKKVGDLINNDSGKLNGWSFEVQFTRDSDGSAKWEIVRDNNTYIPNDILRPELYDTFVLEGFDVAAVDDLYVEKAEQELLEKAQKYIEEHNTDTSTYSCTLMPDYAKKGIKLQLGTRINLINEALIPCTTDEDGRRWGRKSRVIGFEICLDIPYDNPVYTIGEKPSYSRFGAIEDSVDALKYSMAGTIAAMSGSSGSSGRSVYVIGQADVTPESDTNVYSALRSRLEFFCRKAKEVADYLWTFTQGLLVGNYVEHNSGAKIDADGEAEVGSLHVRKSVEVKKDVNVGREITVQKAITMGAYQPGSHGGRMWADELGKIHIETDYLEAREKLQAKEVEIQEQTHVGGCQIISPAAMRCSRVQPLIIDGEVAAYVCYFAVENAEGVRVDNQFRIGDLAKCETFNIVRQDNGMLGNHYYWRKVTACGYTEPGDELYSDDNGPEGYIVLSNAEGEFAQESDVPMEGDRIVTVGNCDPAMPDRSNLIVLSSFGTGSPYIYQYKGITTFSLDEKNLKIAISPSGNRFCGSFTIENENISLEEYVELTTLDVVEGAIDAHVSRIDANEQNIAALTLTAEALQASINKVDATLDSAYKELNSKIEATAEGLKTSVEMSIKTAEGRITEAYRSEINQTAEQISLKVDKIIGYENIVKGGSTGQGWSCRQPGGSMGAVSPDGDGWYEIVNDTISPMELRTASFLLRADTTYALSFEIDSYTNNIKDISFAVWRGNGLLSLTSETILIPHTIDGTAHTIAGGRVVHTFTTNAFSNGAVYLAITHGGNVSGTVGTTTLRVRNVMIEQGSVAHEYVEDAIGLLPTGIDILDRKLLFTANEIEFQNNDGERSMLIDENGHIQAELIDVGTIVARQVIAGDEDGQRVEVDPERKAVEVYDADGSLCSTFNGEAHPNGIDDLYKEAQQGEVTISDTSSRNLRSGSLHIDGTDEGVEHTYWLYSDIWPSSNPASTPTSVKVTNGVLKLYAYSPAYSDDTDTVFVTPQYYAPAFARASIRMELQVSQDKSFSKYSSSVVFSQAVEACSSNNIDTSGDNNDEVYGGIYHEAAWGTTGPSPLSLIGRNANAYEAGYCRLALCVNVIARKSGSYVEALWGGAASSGSNLAVSYTNEFYMSNFFANGFALGISKERYVSVYERNGNMNFEAVESGYGLRVNNEGVQVKHHGGNWMPMPMFVWKALVNFNTTDDYYISQQKSFDGRTISKPVRTVVDKHIHITFTFPTQWSTFSFGNMNTIVNIVGMGSQYVKGLLIGVYGNSLVVELSDSDRSRDGDFMIELFAI